MKKPFVSIICILCILFSGCAKSAKDYISSGYAYLDEGKYEEAIIAFTSAIEIEEQNVDAYKGRAKALVNDGQYDQALNDYEVILQTDSCTIEDYNEVVELCLQQNDYEKAGYYISLKKENYGEASLTDEDNQIISAGKTIDKMFEVGQSNDPSGFEPIIMSEDFNLLSIFATEKGLPFLIERNGKALGLYDTNDGLMVFFGDMKNGIRSGKGYWFDTSLDQFRICYCDWGNDSPNGYFEIIGLDGHIGASGQMINGLYDGVVEYDIPNFGFFHITFNNGIPKIIDVLDSDPPRYVFAKNERGDESAMIASLEKDLQDKWGIWGYGYQG